MVYQRKRSWYIGRGNGSGYYWDADHCLGFFGGSCTIKGDGSVEGALPESNTRDLRQAIRKYAGEYARRLFNGEIEQPGPGDCRYCGMVVSAGEHKGQAWGDASRDNDHLRSHIGLGEEGQAEIYYAPSLVVNACRQMGQSQVMTAAVRGKLGLEHEGARSWATFLGEREGDFRRGIAKTIRRYLYWSLGMPY